MNFLPRAEVTLKDTLIKTFHLYMFTHTHTHTPLRLKCFYFLISWLFLLCCRYDYEQVESDPANQMMANLDKMVTDSSIIGKQFQRGDKCYKVSKMDNFEYTDPIDGSISKKQVM